MPNNIWIDGPNGCGKTYAARLLETHGYKYVHNGRPKIFNRRWMKFKYKLFELTHCNCVIDRSFPSEWVHGIYERGNTQLTSSDCKNLTMFLSKHHSLMLLYYPESVYDAAQRIAYRAKYEEHPLTPDATALNDITQLYITYARLTNTKIVPCTYIAEDSRIKDILKGDKNGNRSRRKHV